VIVNFISLVLWQCVFVPVRICCVCVGSAERIRAHALAGSLDHRFARPHLRRIQTNQAEPGTRAELHGAGNRLGDVVGAVLLQIREGLSGDDSEARPAGHPEPRRECGRGRYRRRERGRRTLAAKHDLERRAGGLRLERRVQQAADAGGVDEGDIAQVDAKHGLRFRDEPVERVDQRGAGRNVDLAGRSTSRQSLPVPPLRTRGCNCSPQPTSAIVVPS